MLFIPLLNEWERLPGKWENNPQSVDKERGTERVLEDSRKEEVLEK